MTLQLLAGGEFPRAPLACSNARAPATGCHRAAGGTVWNKELEKKQSRDQLENFTEIASQIEPGPTI